MKALLLFLLFVSSFQLNAQMTNAEVYNFEIGDVHQTKLSGTNPPIRYHLDTIVGKVFGADSITYTIQRKEFFNGPSPTYPIFNTSIETLIITNLTSYVDHFYYPSCLPAEDTTIIGSCGEEVNKRESVWDSTCFEPPIWTSTIHEGLGGPYHDVYDFSVSADYQYELIYSNTSQWGECGNYFDIYVGIEELTIAPRKLIKIVDYLGREVPFSSNTPLIYIYDDWSTQKIFIVE